MINSGKEASHIKLGFQILFLLLLLFLLPSFVLPQERTCENRQLPVFVTDKGGSMVTTLTSADFEVKNHGAPISVVAWNPDARRHRMVILLDASGSMHGFGPRLWPVALALARHASSVGGKDNDVALVLFADRVIDTVDFSRGRDAVRNKLVEITNDPALPVSAKSRNSTTIYDVLKEGVRMLGTPTSADSLLVITDGIDEGSKTKPDEIVDLLTSSMTRVFAILVDPLPGNPLPGDGFFRPKVFAFEKVVQRSGGKVFGPIDAAEFRNSAKTAETRNTMDERLDRFYLDILTNYVLTVHASAMQKPENIRLFLTDSTQRRLKKAQIFFPHQIGSCSTR